MANSMNSVAALFIVTLILVAPSVLAGETAEKVDKTIAKAADCNKQCEGKGTPADIDICKQKCSLTEQITYAVLQAGACRQGCDKLKNDKPSFDMCEKKCRDLYERSLSEIEKGQNL